MNWPNRIRTMLAVATAGLALLPAAADADRAYSLRYGHVERGDITMAANTIVTCPDSSSTCASARAGTGTVLRNSAWVMVPIDIDSDPSTFDSSSADLKIPAGASILYAGLYWGSDTKAMPEGVDAPNPAARGTVKLAAPDGAGYRTISASVVDSDRYFLHRYQGFADVTSLVRSAGAGTYTVANVQASTGKDQYGGWALIVAFKDTSKPVRWLGLYDGFRDFGGDDPADVPLTGFQTPASGTVKADFGMIAYEGDLGVEPDTARINGRDLVDPLHKLNNYWNASITDQGAYVNSKNPNYVNELGMDANIMDVDGYLPNNAGSAMLHMEVATDLVMPGAMTLVSDQAASAPANTAAPSVSGTARDGQTLTASPGTWSGTAPITYAYRWRRCDSSGAACVDIDGATASTYEAAAADVGKTIRVQVTASNVVSSASAGSAQTAVVAGRAPVNTAAPVVSGTARDGETLSASTGTWSGTTPIAYAYQWQRCEPACSDIADADSATYVLTPADVGETIRVRVTATNSGGSTPATSAPTAAVAARPPASVAPPAVSGTARDGQTLSSTVGTWTGTPTISYERQWQRCDSSCSDIAGATASTYALTPADVGSTIRVRVTATNAGGSAAVTSAPSAVVAAAAPAVTTVPAVTGTARDGQVLSSTTGTWSGTPTIGFARQWQRCDSAGGSCLDIPNATGASYAVVSADVGRTLRVEVTAVNAGGSTVAVSAPSAVVLAAAPAMTAAPTVTGTARDGQTLSSTTGTWTGTPTISFARQWRRCDADGDGCVDIAGATGASYGAVAADVGRTLRVEVTATNAGGSAVATSAPSAVVAAAAPANSVAPAVTGTARDGQTLSSTTGTWTGTPTISFARQWQRCGSNGDGCTDIANATGTTYVLTAGDVGSTIRVEVTATNGGGSTTALSAPTAVATAAAPAVTAAPAITGTARDGQTLSSTVGSWTGTPTITYARQWQRCDSNGSTCEDVAGATGASYALGAADVGRRMRVRVTASNAGGSSSTFSTATTAVGQEPPSSTSLPAISGTARDGQLLSASTGGWRGTAPLEFTYQWRRCDSAGAGCAVIDGATGSSYELAPGDVGHTIRVVVTAANGGGSASATSGQTAVVVAGAPVNTAPPSIAGTARDGERLTAADGLWSGTPTIAYTRRWRRCDSGGNDCANIAGATGATYDLTAADVGHTLRVLVTATNGGGERSAESAPTAVVAAVPPAVVARPALNGVAREGEELALGDGSWSGSAPLALAYSWERCDASCVPIPGATGPRYTLGATDVGKRVRGVVTASNAGGTAAAASDQSAVVAAKPPPPAPDPVPPAPTPEPQPNPEPQPKPEPHPEPDPRPDPPAPSESFAASQWKSSTGTGLRLRLDGATAITSASFAIPAAMLPQRGDAGRVAGRLTTYPASGKPRTWTLRATRGGGLATGLSRGPRLRLGRGTLRITSLPAGRTVKLTLYTRDRTSPNALVKPGATADLNAWLRTAAGTLHHLTYRLERPR